MTDLDTRARDAVRRARVEVAAVDVPPERESTARRVAARHRRTSAVLALATVAIAAGSAIAIGATRSDRATKPSVAISPFPSATTASTTIAKRPLAVLQFREVTATQPPHDCQVAHALQSPFVAAVLQDRTHQECYAVGPVIAGNFAITSAGAVNDPANGGWVINVEFATDDFVARVATPYVNRQVAMVVDGVVESAPTINPGITGRSITISGTFTEAEAKDLARRLAP